jgi:hypothetical protein
MTNDVCPCCEAKRAADLEAREWKRQSKQWEKVAQLQRASLDAAEKAIRALTLERDALEHRLGEAHQGLTVAEGG